MTEQKTIIILDDDPDVRLTLSTIVESLGYKCISFASGKDALADVNNLKADLALVDIMMPEMNGYEFVEELKKIDGYESIPVIMVTAKDQDEEILDGYKQGADYYITKPFTAKQLEYGIKMFI